MRRALAETGLTLCAIGSAVLGASTPAVTSYIPALASLSRLSVISGLALALCGVVLLLVSLVTPGFTKASEHVAAFLTPAMEVRSATPNDLRHLNAYLGKHLGEQAPNVELMRHLQVHYSEAFQLMFQVERSEDFSARRRLVGAFKIIPLTRAGARAVEQGELAGPFFTSEHVCKRWENATAYWVGDVVATGLRARAQVVAQITARFSNLTTTVYARPLSHAGLRSMTRFGFVQVSDGESAPAMERICKLELCSTDGPIRERLDSAARRERKRQPIEHRHSMVDQLFAC